MRANPWNDVPFTLDNNEISSDWMHFYMRMNVKEERKLMSEIRAQGASISSTFILSNGRRATEFALYYILRHHLRRKQHKNCVSPVSAS